MAENVIDNTSGRTWWSILFSQFRSGLILILMLAMIETFIIGEVRDGLFILGAILINVTIGFFQELKAEKRLESLKSLVSERAFLRKNGEWVEVLAKNLKVGDLVKLSIGQKVPADGVIVTANGLLINEAILTGESVLVHKEVNALGMMGCVVEKGIGEMKVSKIGRDTKLGSIATVSNQVIESSPLKLKIDNFSKILSIVICVVVAIFFVVSLLQGRPIKELLPLSAALMVAAIPEGMVISLTVILSMGMRRLLEQKAIVKSLTAAETLGSVTTICLDKTGTITLGKMTAIKAEVLNKKDEEEICREALLCNDYRDPLEYAMADYAVLKLGKSSKEEIEKRYPRTSGEAFDPKKKIIITVHKTPNNKTLSIMSGAPEVVLDKSKVKSIKEKVGWEKKIKEAGDKGYRMVAFANKLGSGDYRFLGLILFVDPVREGVEESLKEAMNRGISLKVITGDYKETAWVAMQGVGLVGKGVPVDNELVMTGEELAVGGQEIKEKIHKAILFARTTPEQKLAIVEALQKSGEVVAMMGDGVNDAPALKKADIGITVFESSDVAREAADVVLLDNNFKTIIQAVIGGREMMLNIRRVMIFLLSGTFSTLFFTLGTIVMGMTFPLTTTIILLINFGVETVPSVIISLWPGKVAEKRITKPTKGELLGFSSGLLILIFGLIIGVLGVVLYYFNLPLSILIGWLTVVPVLLSIMLRGGVFDNVIK